jgi:DNA polymerase-4
MASGINKPNGLTVILPSDAEAFVEALPIEKFHGIGKVTAHKMHELGIRTGADLKRRSHLELRQQFGKVGSFYYKIARAEDERIVEPNRIRKSIGAETSFAQDLSDRAIILQEIETIAQTVKQRLESHQTGGRTLTLKVKFANYQQITRSKTLTAPLSELDTILAVATELFVAVDKDNRSIRLLGISISNLDLSQPPQGVQLPLFLVDLI